MPWEHLLLLQFSRCPKAFREALLCGQELRECRLALAKAGFSVELPGGALAFVCPHEYRFLQDLASRIEGIKLTASHVICSPKFEASILEAVGNLRCRDRTKVKSIEKLQMQYPFRNVGSLRNLDHTTQGQQLQFESRTFLSFGMHAPVDCKSVASSSDARRGWQNPRQKTFVMDSL